MNILVVVAHPDDEILGCGGTISRLSSENNIFTLILGEGITSRDINEEQKKAGLKKLKADSIKANKLIGVKEVFFSNFRDNAFDTVPLLSIIKSIEKVSEEVKPEIVFTHHMGDLNIDHQIVHRAVMTAFRPIGMNKVKDLYSFEVLSSTEWQEQHPNFIFTPNIYFNIEDTIRNKIEAMKIYQNEIRQYPHPRSVEGIEINARKRGLEVGLSYAEAFHLIRSIHF